MIPFANIDTLIHDAGATHAKICDARNNKIIEAAEASPEALITKLKTYETLFSGYGTLVFKVGTEKDEKNSFTNASRWVVSFSQGGMGYPNQQHQVIQNPAHNQAINAELLQARVENERLKVTAEFDAKLQELQKQIEKKDDGFMKYLPGIALFMDIPKERMERMLQLGQVQSYLNGGGPAVQQTTPQTAATSTASTSDWTDQNVTKIEEGLKEISESGKIPAEDIIFLTERIKTDPEGTRQLIQMLKMQNQAQA